MKRVEAMDLTAKRTFVRVDFNVPMNTDGEISDDGRIVAALPTLQTILQKDAKLILASHLGRPRGERKAEFSLAPVAQRLSELLGCKVTMAPDCIGDEVQRIIAEMAPGDVVLLENLRFHSQEESNDAAFGKALAELCDVFINDAFAVCHRRHASVHAIVANVTEAGAGMLLQKELDYFQKAMDDPSRPLVAVVGGAKVSSKLAALSNMLERVDKIIIGGAMANSFLKYQGLSMGKSLVENECLADAGRIMASAAERNTGLFLPLDLVVAEAMVENAETITVPVQKVPENMMALDIGPGTAKAYHGVLQDAGTVVWNGPMGVFEMPPFSGGTMSLAKSIAGCSGLTIIGGGDTGAAVRMAGVETDMSYISTGGGAFLTLLEGKVLPAVEVLPE